MKLLPLPLLTLLPLLLVPPTQAGICPSYPYIRDFDFAKYTGLWFQQDKQQSSWSAPGRCWQSLYVRDATTGQYKMKILYENTITGNSGMYESSLTLLGPSKPSLIKYSIPYTFLEDSFQVLATDYETYSIEYQCDPNGILPKSENVFLLTRKKTPSAAVLQKAYAIMHRYSIDIRKLERVDQTCGGLKLTGVVKATDMMRGDLIETQFGSSQGRLPPEGELTEEYLDYPEEGNRLPESRVDNQLYSLETSASVMDERRPNAPRRRQDTLRRRHEPSSYGNHQERFRMGQSLATRLWHILHTPAH